MAVDLKSNARVVNAQMEAAGAWFPPTQGYSLTECLEDLLKLAARHLRIGGRLVFFLPAAPGKCEGHDVPRHPALGFVSNCEQVGCTPRVWYVRHAADNKETDNAIACSRCPWIRSP